MSDLNRCMFIGRLGADPEMRTTQGGEAVANFRIACGWKGKGSEGTEWVPVVAFGRLAEVCGEFLRKGSQVYIGGTFRTRKWQDRDGNDRWTTEIVAREMQMLGGRRERDGAGQGAPARDAAPAPAQAPWPVPADEPFNDDIPF